MCISDREDELVPKEVCRDVPGEFRVSRLVTEYFQYREDGTGNLLLKDNDDGLYLSLIHI